MINETQNDEVYSTRDLTLAAVLVTLKYPMVSMQFQVEGMKNQMVGYFEFENTPSLREARQKFTQGLLMVEPRGFMMSIHGLKAEVSNFQKNPHNRTF